MSKDRPVEASDVLAEIKEQLAWRGPNGGMMGHIVVTRAKMEILVRSVEGFQHLASSLADEVMAGEKAG